MKLTLLQIFILTLLVLPSLDGFVVLPSSSTRKPHQRGRAPLALLRDDDGSFQKQVKAGVSIAAISFTLLSNSPAAYAKGGGTGFSSSSASSSYYSGGTMDTSYYYYDYGSSSSYSTHNDGDEEESNASYPAYRRHDNHPWDPDYSFKDFKACTPMPMLGEPIEVLVHPEIGGYYTPGRVTLVDKDSCKFVVQYGLLGLFKKTLYESRNGEVYSLFALFGFGTFGPIVWQCLRDAKNKVESLSDALFGYLDCRTFAFSEFDAESVTSDKEWSNLELLPQSGLYEGITEESDGITQVVKVWIDVKNSGRLDGFGWDSVDGFYRVGGRWKKNRLCWKERYLFGYDVEVWGQEDGRGRILCDFRSSNRVVGTFKLMKK